MTATDLRRLFFRDRARSAGAVGVGTESAVGCPDLERSRRTGKLRWLVVTDLWETETANFGNGPAVADKIDTEVFLSPTPLGWKKKEP